MAAFCTGGSLVALPPVAHAQDAAVSRRAAVLEQVLVTAQRREQAQQEVPISIQVVGTDLLDDVAADDLGDLTVFVPGLDVSSESPTQPLPVGDAQSRLDARLAWKNATDRWGLAAFVTNLLDDQYVTSVNGITASTLGTPFASASEPRAWGFEAFVSF